MRSALALMKNFYRAVTMQGSLPLLGISSVLCNNTVFLRKADVRSVGAAGTVLQLSAKQKPVTRVVIDVQQAFTSAD